MTRHASRLAPLPSLVKYPTVSVVIPCYAQAHYLAGAIASAVAQDHRPLEIVVVDDGSPDDTAAVARAAFDQAGDAAVVLIEQVNAGLSAARNAAIAACHGDVIVLLDADDELAPGAISARLAIMRSDPRVAMVVGHHRELSPDGQLLDRIPAVRSLPDDAFESLVRQALPPVGWAIRREALAQCGTFDTELEACEDWDLLIRVAARFKVGYDASTSQRYRVAPGSMSTKFDRQFRWSRTMLRANRGVAPDWRRYRVAETLAGYYQARYLLGRARLIDGRRARLAALAWAARRQPAFGAYALAVVATYPIWRRNVGL